MCCGLACTDRTDKQHCLQQAVGGQLHTDLPVSQQETSTKVAGLPGEPLLAPSAVASQSYDGVTSSSDDPAEVTARVADAFTGNKLQRQRQGHHQKLLQHEKQPNLAHAPNNEGRLVISKDTLLRWLHSKHA